MWIPQNRNLKQMNATWQRRHYITTFWSDAEQEESAVMKVCFAKMHESIRKFLFSHKWSGHFFGITDVVVLA